MSRKKAHALLKNQKNVDIAIIPPRKCLGIVSAFALFLCTGTLLSAATAPANRTPQGEVVTNDNIKDILDRLSENSSEDPDADDSSYSVVMTSSWTFETSSSVSKDAYVENSDTNHNTVYFTVTLPDESLPIYVSPHLPVGSSIDDIRLNGSLEAGVYNATITYYLLDENNTSISSIPMRLKLTVNSD